MKTHHKTSIILGLSLALTATLSAQQKVSERTSLAAAALAPATDILPIVDISAGLSGSKKITIDDLFTGWGMTASGKTLVTQASAAAQRSVLGLGTAATAASSSFEPALGNPGTNGHVLSSTTAGVRSWIAPGAGGGDLASQAEAEAGTENTKTMTPLRTAQAITALGVDNGSDQTISGQKTWTDEATYEAGVIANSVAADNVTAGSFQVTGNTTLTGNLDIYGATTFNLASSATGDLYYRASGGEIARLGIGGPDQYLGVASGLPSWVTPPATGDLASQAEAEAGTENTKTMTPLRTAQAIAELAVGEVTLAGAETLTNKTLSDPKITLSGGAGDQPGDMYYNDGTGTLMRLRLGDDGDTLIADAFTGKPVWGVSGRYLQPANNLADLVDFAAARSNLGLGLAATANTGGLDGELPFWDSTLAPAAHWVGSDGTGEVILGDFEDLPAAMGLGTAAELNTGDILARVNNLNDLANVGTARTNLGLGTAATQPSSAFEPALGNPGTNGYVLSSTTAGVRSWVPAGAGTGDLLSTNNLSDLANAGTARSNLGLQALSTVVPGTNVATALAIPADATGGMFRQGQELSATTVTASGVVSITDATASTTPSTGALVIGGGVGIGGQITGAGAFYTTNTAGGGRFGTSSVYISPLGSSEMTINGNFRPSTTNTRSLGLTGSRWSTVFGVNGDFSGTLAVGSGHTTSGVNSFAAGGNNTASGLRSFVTGSSNTASGSNSFVTGAVNTANSYCGVAIGTQSSTRGVGYAFVQAASALATVGDAQVGRYVFRVETSTASPTKLTTDTTGSSQQVTLPNNSTYSFTGQVSARSSGGDSAAWRFTGTIERGANAAATALIGTPTITDTNAEAGAAAWTISITADTTNGAISITATGAAATNIRWVAQVETAEVVY